MQVSEDDTIEKTLERLPLKKGRQVEVTLAAGNILEKNREFKELGVKEGSVLICRPVQRHSIQQLPSDEVKQKLVKAAQSVLGEMHATKAAFECFCFLWCRAIDEECSPPPRIDQVWHQLILDTRSYGQKQTFYSLSSHPMASRYEWVCEQINDGKMIHHDPATDVKQSRVDLAKAMRRQIFFETDPDEWCWESAASINDLRMIRQKKRSRDVSPNPDDGSFQVFVKMLSGKTLTFAITMEMTLCAVKQMIESVTGIPRGEQRLLFNGRNLHDDEKRLGTFEGFGTNVCLYLVLKVSGC